MSDEKTTDITVTVPYNSDAEIVAITLCIRAMDLVRNAEARARVAWYLNERYGARIEIEIEK